MKNAYERLVRPLLFSVDPETAHNFTISCLRAASHFGPILDALRHFSPNPKPKRLFDINFPNPVGLAAGLDKNGVALPAWAALGFGFVEIGTVTARAQPGNPRPRIFRFPEQQALINRLGFNNDGAAAIAGRLGKLKRSGRWPGSCRIGINIGKSMATPITEASADYLYSFQLLREFADYIVLNVSSPNTPGLRELQGAEALAELLRTIGEKNVIARKPIVVKIAPDLAPDQLGQIIAVCEANGVAAIIATNTTLVHSAIPADKDQRGGLSGAPVRQKSSDLVRAIAARSKIPIIASGGVLDADSAREKFEAGARLVQIYTGLIYRGPGLLREIAEAIP
jgi:dihydroorotate dehydrogenase